VAVGAAAPPASRANRASAWAGVIVYLIGTGVLLFMGYAVFTFVNENTFPQQAGSSTSSIFAVAVVVFALAWIAQGVRIVRPLFRGGSQQPIARPALPGQGVATQPHALGYALWLGLRLGIVALVVIIGGGTLVYATQQYVGSLVILAAVAVLAIRAGLLPARRSGSLGAATLAGTIVALATVIGFPVLPGQSQYQALYVGFGMVALLLSIVSGLVGRRQYTTKLRAHVPLGQALISSLLITALFIMLGGLFGGALSLMVSNGAPTLTLNAPGVYLGGGVGGGVGALLALSMVRTMIQRDWLRRHGTHIRAHVIEVETRLNWSFFLGGPVGEGMVDRPRPMYYIVVAEWTDPSTRQQHIFRSEHLATPSPVVRGDSITVHMDPQNPNRYLMEV
jgi:hypothetical protein